MTQRTWGLLTAFLNKCIPVCSTSIYKGATEFKNYESHVRQRRKLTAPVAAGVWTLSTVFRTAKCSSPPLPQPYGVNVTYWEITDSPTRGYFSSPINVWMTPPQQDSASFPPQENIGWQPKHHPSSYEWICDIFISDRIVCYWSNRLSQIVWVWQCIT